VLVQPIHRSIDGGGLSGLACGSSGLARSTREKVADVPLMCTVAAASGGGPRPSLAHYVTEMGPMDGATAAGGRSCCLSSLRAARCEGPLCRDKIGERVCLEVGEKVPRDRLSGSGP
jgi:hypothetical protein